MHPDCFTVFGKTIYWYGVFTALGFLAAMAHWTWMAKRKGYALDMGSDVAVWLMVGGVLGARAAYVVANWQAEFAAHPAEILRIDRGGLIYYGGFLGGCLAMILYARRRRMGLWALSDFAVTALPLGHAFGRIGCFLNGCCYGKATTCGLAVHMPYVDTNPAVFRHPVQLYEAGLNFVLYALLTWLYLQRPRRPGWMLAVYLLLYPVIRFSLEFLRGDPRDRVGALTTAQGVSLALFAAGLLLLVWLRRTPSPSEPGVSPPEA